MKVALLSDCYLPRLGGIEVQVHDLATHLSARGHQVHVFTATPSADPAGRPTRPWRQGSGDVVETKDGLVVHHLAVRLPWDLPVNPFAPSVLRRVLRAERFDVAHVHTGVVSPFAMDSARVAVGLGLPTTMTWHCMLGPMTPAFRLARYVRAWAARGVAMNAVSAVAAEAVQQVVGDAGTVTVLPNGIEPDRWRAGLLERAGQADTSTDRLPGVRVVTAMRLATRKRPVPLLETLLAARALVPPDRSMSLQVYGDGPDRGRVERFVAEHGMRGWVSLPGRVPRESLPDRYAEADVYVSSAKLESFGIAALEARTAGLPVVARRGSGIGEFVTDGVNGVLARDDAGMAAAVARLVADDDLRERMRAYNALHVPDQTWDRVVGLAEAEYARASALAGSSA